MDVWRNGRVFSPPFNNEPSGPMARRCSQCQLKGKWVWFGTIDRFIDRSTTAAVADAPIDVDAATTHPPPGFFPVRTSEFPSPIPWLVSFLTDFLHRWRWSGRPWRRFITARISVGRLGASPPATNQRAPQPAPISKRPLQPFPVDSNAIYQSASSQRAWKLTGNSSKSIVIWVHSSLPPSLPPTRSRIKSPLRAWNSKKKWKMNPKNRWNETEYL